MIFTKISTENKVVDRHFIGRIQNENYGKNDFENRQNKNNNCTFRHFVRPIDKTLLHVLLSKKQNQGIKSQLKIKEIQFKYHSTDENCQY